MNERAGLSTDPIQVFFDVTVTPDRKKSGSDKGSDQW